MKTYFRVDSNFSDVLKLEGNRLAIHYNCKAETEDFIEDNDGHFTIVHGTDRKDISLMDVCNLIDFIDILQKDNGRNIKGEDKIFRGRRIK